jgi:formate/nitrite transporter
MSPTDHATHVVHAAAAQPGPLDALVPADMARRAEEVGVRKAHTATASVFVLAVLAGAFIALGAIFALTVTAGSMTVTAGDGAVAQVTAPYGITRLLGGIAFSLGLILVVIAGAELFTGNVLLVIAWASHRLRTVEVARNWTIVFAGNLAGALSVVALAFLAGWYAAGAGAVGVGALETAQAKVERGFVEAVAAGILCNGLVCLAVWLTYSARTTTDRILAIVPPIAAFVAAGFEHSVANMFFIPMGIAIRTLAPASFWEAAGTEAAANADVDLAGFVANLVPVTIGNVVGGGVLVAGVYWFVYLRRGPDGTPTRSPFRRSAPSPRGSDGQAAGRAGAVEP